MNLNNTLRKEIARHAARLMCEQGILDFGLAKTKALDCVAGPRGPTPTNLEIADCIADYLRVFEADESAQRLSRLRGIALKAMELCAPFSPRLVGAAVTGLAILRSPVQVHVFCAFDEVLDLHLGERNIPFDAIEKRFRHPDGREIRRPACVFVADDIDVELVIFAEDDVRWAPLSPVDGKPMTRWTVKDLRSAISAQKKTA